LPVIGFVMFGTLDQQFFPPTNRNQFQIEFELPSQSAIAETQTQILAARDLIRQHERVDDIHWFMGESAPSFFYNVLSNRRNAPNYAQGIVQLNDTTDLRQTIQDLQWELDAAFPDAQVLVKQLEQGPPFDAPIELRIYGSDMAQLRQVGNDLRGELAQVSDVIHTQADLTEGLPKLALTVDEVQARQAGLDNSAIARQLNTALEGSVGGSVLEGTEDIPVRVRLSDQRRGDLGEISALDLVAGNGEALPLNAIADLSLIPDLAQITRKDGQRINTVQGFITAGALPDNVLTRFKQRLEDTNFALPPGYRLEYGGEADARGDAVGNLLSTVGVLVILMTATLVLSFNSFGLAALIASVAVFAVGLAALALWLFNSLFGFTAILGTLGLIGLAINDSIVVLAALREDPLASQGDRRATQAVVLKATRHVAATTLTTITGFIPLLMDSTGFWPPLAIAIAGGLGGATLLA
ncbi:MAG: efflux RND transporter permease subunit, partial [Cyanobacteria bacterium J06659_2]